MLVATPLPGSPYIPEAPWTGDGPRLGHVCEFPEDDRAGLEGVEPGEILLLMPGTTFPAHPADVPLELELCRLDGGVGICLFPLPVVPHMGPVIGLPCFGAPTLDGWIGVPPGVLAGCGVAGFLEKNPGAPPETFLRALADTLRRPLVFARALPLFAFLTVARFIGCRLPSRPGSPTSVSKARAHAATMGCPLAGGARSVFARQTAQSESSGNSQEALIRHPDTRSGRAAVGSP